MSQLGGATPPSCATRRVAPPSWSHRIIFGGLLFCPPTRRRNSAGCPDEGGFLFRTVCKRVMGVNLVTQAGHPGACDPSSRVARLWACTGVAGRGAVSRIGLRRLVDAMGVLAEARILTDRCAEWAARAKRHMGAPGHPWGPTMVCRLLRERCPVRHFGRRGPCSGGVWWRLSGHVARCCCPPSGAWPRAPPHWGEAAWRVPNHQTYSELSDLM